MQAVTSKTKTSLWPLIILIIGFPMGIAMQSILSSIAILYCLYHVIRYPRQPLPREILWATVGSLGFVVYTILATLINNHNPSQDHIHYLFGHFAFYSLPILACLTFGVLTPKQFAILYRVALGAAIVWGLICFSQSLIGWRIDSIALTWDYKRPRGLYSHPLTPAYAAFLFWPFAVQKAFRDMKKLDSWLLFAAIGTILVVSNSRTIQAVGLLCLIYNGFKLLEARGRWFLAAILALGTLTIATTPNRIRLKVEETLARDDVKNPGHYADDRLAYWDAHREMIVERPIQGHGHSLGRDYRTPYYEKIGLKDFKYRYEAHNTFIQILANSGLIGLGFFLLWLGMQWRLAGKLRDAFSRSVLMQTMGFWALASLTQNSFQDAEVRMGLTMITLTLGLLPRNDQITGQHLQ